jgi:hypothetical protein
LGPSDKTAVHAKQPITLSRTPFLVVGATLFGLVVLVILTLSTPYSLQGWYFRYFLSPELEQEFGFTVEERVLTEPGVRTGRYLVLATVAAEGPLAKAGARAGDVPLNCHHGCTYGFYSALLAGRDGGVVRLRLVNAGEFQKEAPTVREVVIPSPDTRP